jgi:peptidyl-prolyl cis-trans isomerase SurA
MRFMPRPQTSIAANSLARIRRVMSVAAVAMAVLAGTNFSSVALAQGLFSPVLRINDRVITQYDVTQRALFLQTLNLAGPDPEAEALKILTEEVLQRIAARRSGVRLAADAVGIGMSEFATRAELTTEQFLDELGAEGVAPETFEQFVTVGLEWRELVRQRFGGRVIVTDNEVERAMSTAAELGNARILLSEIFLPTDPEFADAVAEIVPQILAISSFDSFSQAARQVSVAGTRDVGGRLEWMPVANLPPPIARQVGDAATGSIVGPITVPGAIAFFQIREKDSTRNVPAGRVMVDYARLQVPGGRTPEGDAAVARIRSEARECSDLSVLNADLPEEYFTRAQTLMPALPQGVALELAKLDENEISDVLVEGGSRVVLMLCSRQLQQDPEQSMEQVRDRIASERINTMAENYLQELHAEAEIRRP